MDIESTAFGETLMGSVPLPLKQASPPASTSCPELDLSVTLSLDQLELPEQSGTRERGRPRTRQRQVRFAVSPSTCSPDRPHIATVIPEACDSEKPNNKGKQTVSGQSATPLVEEAALNTTLALKAELQQLVEVEFDAQKAVQEKLQNSTVTQEYIRTRASQGLNFPRSQHLYRDLVSVTLSDEQLISQVLQDRPALAPPTTTYSGKFQSRPAEGPDLLAFCNLHQLIRETPLLPGDQIPLGRPRPVPRSSHTTFHLHERHRQWEA